MVPHVSVKWRYFSAHPAHLHSLSHTSIHSPFPPSLYKDEQDELEEERKGEEDVTPGFKDKTRHTPYVK
jgi:hypothetical protein